MFVKTQKILRKFIVFFTVFFTTLFLSLAWFLFGFHIDREIKPKISFWMEHDWSNGKKNFQDLKNQLEGIYVSDLYFHVGPINADGSLAPDLSINSDELASLDTVNYAWIGQIRNKLDLDNSDIRLNIIESSSWLLEQGFDGIHLDIEPIRHEDESFFLLLAEMNEYLPSAKISVAMDEWQPDLISKVTGWFFKTEIKSYWNSSQVREAAKHADQIVVMTYDSGLHDPKLFSWWVEQQVIALSNLLPLDVELFIGIPDYSEGSNFDPHAENLDSGILGFKRGYANLRTQTNRSFGLAIYSFWESNEAELETLRHI